MFTVVISLGGVVTGRAAVDGLFAAVDQVGGGPGVCQPRIVANAASEHAGPAGDIVTFPLRTRPHGDRQQRLIQRRTGRKSCMDEERQRQLLLLPKLTWLT